MTHTISKVLSANDTGENGAHQAGILIPKDKTILSFFPALQKQMKNPRCSLVFTDTDGVTRWKFDFIYYNNKFYGGTRNEYRLTGMTAYIRSMKLEAGDSIELTKDENGRLHITAKRQQSAEEENGVLKLSTTWKVIRIPL
ncbi:hypothetical protein M1B72_17745 [Geomonas paludis]|uniref:Restriction endonuclease type II EcoRII N-terminal domain-containing protein n=1 Tax=Geomonas paludis TaxID=2740185 RepID=A0ABY4LBB7_9BACT|nr:EcoRII N-terminal effector-binding domain-containing protein [Geomonas paludis]UPU35267.1 hypothetical protein M1B72_17745 [Geomonas paludis]